MFDPLKVAPGYLRALADRLQDLMKPGAGVPPEDSEDGEDGEPQPDEGKWLKDFDMSRYDTDGSGGKPPFWDNLLVKYRGNTFLDPVPQIFKRRYVYDREVGDRPIFREAEEYSDIVCAAIPDLVMEEMDARISRKTFDIPWFQTELPPEGCKGKPYTFFLCDISGSMDGPRAKHACALAQVAAEKVFAEDGVFVWLPFGTQRRDAVEYTSLPPLIRRMREEPFNSGTTHIGDNLKVLSFALNMGTAYTHENGTYTVPGNFDKKRSKVFVVHDGEDKVEPVHLKIPVFAITLANKHDALEALCKKTGGKYLFVKEQ